MRATKQLQAQRLNFAFSLLKRRADHSKVVASLCKRFGISRRQAYRYAEGAAELEHPQPAPEASKPCLFKLPIPLVNKLHRHCDRGEQSQSEVVALALQSYLAKHKHRA